jgi:hypothetical protein
MYQISVYSITLNLWRWEIRRGDALLRCGAAPTRVAAEMAANEVVGTSMAAPADDHGHKDRSAPRAG